MRERDVNLCDQRKSERARATIHDAVRLKDFISELEDHVDRA
jgi:hypothetical protein